MNARWRRMFLLLVLGLATCETATRATDDIALGEDIAVRTELLVGEGRERFEGDIVAVRLTIDNRMRDRNILLVRLFPALSDEGGISWQNAEEGKLSYFRRDDKFYLYDDPLRTTEQVFNRGFIPAGGSLTLTMNIRLLNMPRRFELKYYRLTVEETARSVYFAEYTAAEYRTFGKIPREEVERMLPPKKGKQRTQEEDAEIRRRLRVVLFQPTMLHSYAVSLVTIDCPLRRRTFTIAEAARQIELSADAPHTYCSALKSWIVRQGDRLWMVNETDKREIPSMSFDVLQTIDAMPPGRAIEIDIDMTTPASFTGRKKIVTVPRGSRTVPVLFVEADGLKEFLTEVARERLTIESPPEWGQRRLILKKPSAAPLVPNE